MLKWYHICFCFLSFTTTVFGHEFRALTSNLLQKTQLDSAGFEKSISNTEIKRWHQDDEVLKYNAWLHSFSPEKIQRKSVYFMTHYHIEMSKVCMATDQYTEAYKHIDTALTCFSARNFPLAFYTVANEGAEVAATKADYRRANRFLKKILDSGLFDNDSIRTSATLISMADNSLELHKYIESMMYCRMAYPICFGIKDLPGQIKILLLMYENSYQTVNDTSNLDYLSLAKKLALETNEPSLISDVYTNTGLEYNRQNDPLTAIHSFKLARAYASQVSPEAELTPMIYLRQSYTLADSVDAACSLSENILIYALKTNKVSLLGNAYHSRAWCFAQRSMNDSAIFYLDKAEHYRELYGKSDKSPGFYYNMHKVALLIGDYERVVRYLRKSIDQNLLITRSNNAEELSVTRAGFDYEMQKDRIKKLRNESQRTHEKNIKQRIIIVAIAIILIALFTSLVTLRTQFLKLRTAFSGLVKKNLELDRLNSKLTESEIKISNHDNGLIIKDEDEIYLKLKSLFENEKIHKLQDLSVNMLAGMLETNTTYLSLIINNRCEMTFKTLLNEYRIAEARKLLVSKEYSNFSIEGIALEVGYHSRSAFYQAFRHTTGLTPTEYLYGNKDIGEEPLEEQTE
jgi:AraC-like DNA-binding protein